jgi:hypothetical protein
MRRGRGLALAGALTGVGALAGCGGGSAGNGLTGPTLHAPAAGVPGPRRAIMTVPKASAAVPAAWRAASPLPSANPVFDGPSSVCLLIPQRPVAGEASIEQAMAAARTQLLKRGAQVGSAFRVAGPGGTEGAGLVVTDHGLTTRQAIVHHGRKAVLVDCQAQAASFASADREFAPFIASLQLS